MRKLAETDQAPPRVVVRVPSMLRQYSGGRGELALPAQDVGSALKWLEQNHQLLYRSVCDETGAVRRHVNVFVNTFDIRDLDGLETRLASGDLITILPAVSGGTPWRSV
jgi:sulfur-carrier protein